MTDAEILNELKKADLLLSEYKKIAQPIAEELARRKSLFVFGKEGGYRGHLGCQEIGLNSLCLHIEDEFRGKTYEEYQTKAEDRAYDFELEWSRKVHDAGIETVHVTGHY